MRRIVTAGFQPKLMFLICFQIILVALITAQVPQTINLELIPQKKVRSYIIERKINTMLNFSDIKPSWKKSSDSTQFQAHEKIFSVNDKISHVWNCYKMANPKKSWNGHFMKFELLISKSKNSVMYNDASDFEEIDTGQVYFLDLRLLKGLFNVPVAFEIINIDAENKTMEFSYIDGNKSQGKQVIQFFDNGDGSTKIVHRSYFKSGSHIRDGVFYPYFHTKIIREFHRNMERIVYESIEQEQDLAMYIQ